MQVRRRLTWRWIPMKTARFWFPGSLLKKHYLSLHQRRRAREMDPQKKSTLPPLNRFLPVPAQRLPPQRRQPPLHFQSWGVWNANFLFPRPRVRRVTADLTGLEQLTKGVSINLTQPPTKDRKLQKGGLPSPNLVRNKRLEQVAARRAIQNLLLPLPHVPKLPRLLPRPHHQPSLVHLSWLPLQSQPRRLHCQLCQVPRLLLRDRCPKRRR